MIRAVTIDCSNTLVEDRWDPPVFATTCLAKHFPEVDAAHAGDRYRALMMSTWSDYRAAHEQGEDACEGYWDRLTERWLADIGAPPELKSPVMNTARTLLADPIDGPFSLFPDTRPGLQAMREAGLRLAVVSNWDYSLDRTLQLFGIREYFEFTVASMTVGYEKPQPEIFALALDRLQLRPEEVLHIGDNPMHDLMGARNVGMEAMLIDRTQPDPRPPIIRTLADVVPRL